MSQKKLSRQSFLDAYADFFASQGLPASSGRIFGALLTSSDPLTQAELRSVLSLSDGSVSEGLKLLEAVGLVERAGQPRARPAYFQVAAGSWGDSGRAAVLNLRRTHELAHLTTKHLEQHGVSGRSRLWAASLQAMFDSLLVDLPPVVQASLDAGAREWAKREDAE
jgi:DNA-binding transcriptional regulator GbsR (MarR family)